jgi:hypothetical protein
LINIVSLSPVNALFQSPSWKINTGLETIQHNGCRFCRIGNLNGGIGIAAESAWLKREVYFAFADLVAEYGRVSTAIIESAEESPSALWPTSPNAGR